LFSHVFVGVSDFGRALSFYRALFACLGIEERFCEPQRPWAGWQTAGTMRPLFLIGAPYDQRAHAPGNGQMVAFAATSRELVDRVYITALEHGAPSEGPPGLRPEYHAHYYGAYFRDPDGNKLCVVCHAASPTADREFLHTRLMDAPRERVFRALAEARRLARWWGPKGFSSTFELFEFRPGGIWRFVLHGPDGKNYPNENVFQEIIAPERVVVDHPSADHHFALTITFTAVGNRTLVGWHQLFDSAEQREQIARFVSEANEQNLDRLAAEVCDVA
jgi:uncharacterized protein YndB with AHSA1/START domain/catechol 2,3-dioxygenase-like lactoylglutathione lyase family enzyme